jgi:hypothetical protein
MAQATWIADKLLERGLDVIECRGWETRARPGGPPFNPRGVVCHHTGPWSTIDGMVKLCINGRSDLPGPLCHVVLDPDGTCHVIAAGRANHAGAGNWRGLSGNSSVLGIEAIHSGNRTTPWPPVQVEAFVRCAAALADGIGAEPIMVCGHKEWTPSKIDPVTLDMGEFRAGVGEFLTDWRSAGVAERTQTVPIPVHDYEEAATKTTMVHCGPLDSHGNGWADWQPGLGRDPIIVGVTLLGPSPPDDGYWENQENVTLAAQPRGGAVRITVRNGTPGDTVTCFVTVS